MGYPGQMMPSAEGAGKREPIILAAVSRVARAEADIEELLNELEIRVQPVSRQEPPPPAVSAEKSIREAVGVPLGEELRVVCDRLIHVRNRIRELIDRLEI